MHNYACPHSKVVVPNTEAQTLLLISPVITCAGAADRVDDGDELELDCATGIIVNKTQGTALQGEALVKFILTMIAAGGLQPMILKRQNSPA